MITYDFNYYLSPTTSSIDVSIKDTQGNNFIIHTGLFIRPDMWDSYRQRPLNIYLKKYKKLNTRLDKLRVFIGEYLLKIETDKISTVRRKLTSRMQRFLQEGDLENSGDGFLIKMLEYINSREHLICKSTHRRYRVFYNLMHRYEGSIRKKLAIEDVNALFVRDFLTFGLAENYSESTLHRSIEFIKTILNFLEKRGIRTFVYELSFSKKRELEPIITLTAHEIKQIEQASIPSDLHIARDWLIVSCYTGQRISDFMRFDDSTIASFQGRLCVSFIQQKTKKKLVLPLHPVINKILARYENKFPPKLPAQKYNMQIKQVARLSGIDEVLKKRKRIGHRAEFCTVAKWEAVTSHIGRRSFATNFYGKIPTALLMQATGHSTELMLKKYIGEMNSEMVSQLGEFFDKQLK